MKKMLPYIIVFFVTTLATVIMAVVFVKLRPPAAGGDAVADSASLKALVAKMYGPKLEDLLPYESGTVAAPAQGLDAPQVLQLALQDERKKSAQLADRLRAVMDSSQKALAAADSAQREQRKFMTKVLENMDPASAARILSDFPDGEVKTYILTMKKRQAAKILAALQPDRAARIMR